MRRQIAIVFVAATLLLTALAFQNCGMSGGGFTVATGAKAGFDSSQAARGGSTTAPGSPATGGAATAPTAAPAVACLKPANSAPTLTGITGLPALQTSYATLLRLNTSGIRRTSLTVTAMNSCISKADMTTGGHCPTTSPTPTACQASPMYFVTVSLVCDANSDTTTTCTNFAGKVGQSVNLSDASLGGSISISVSENPNICTPATAKTLLPPFTAPVGSIKITRLDSLATGGQVSIDLAGITLQKIGDASISYTLAGTIAGEIVTPVACTP